MKVRLQIPPTSKRRHGWRRVVDRVKNALNCTLVVEVGCSPAQRPIGRNLAAGRDDLA